MATNSWDLRAGFTKDYDLATSAITEADKQFREAQKIVQNAYALDKTAATQQSDIDRINQENLEKTLISQSRVGDFESAQEIQQALESLGSAVVEQPQDQQPEDVQPKVTTDDGRVIDDPKSPLVAAPNEPKPPTPQPQARPMTEIERLKAVEPMLKTPKAKYALRQMVQKTAAAEALSIHNVAPDEAFNILLKEGLIRGTPLIANDDGTYSRRMPDGRNAIRMDRTEASAFVGDIINKTNNYYKLASEQRKLEQEMRYDVEGARRKSVIKQGETAAEFRLRSQLESQKYKQDMGLEGFKSDLRRGEINLRADRGLGVSASGDDGNYSAADTVYGTTPQRSASATPSAPTSRAMAFDRMETPLNQTIERSAAANGINPIVFKRLIGTESDFNPNAVNTIDGQPVAFGVAQIYKSNIGNKPGQISMEDAMNPEKALPYAAKLFASKLKAAGGDYNEALMMYKGATSAEGRVAMQNPINDILSGMTAPAASKPASQARGPQDLAADVTPEKAAQIVERAMSDIKKARETGDDELFAKAQTALKIYEPKSESATTKTKALGDMFNSALHAIATGSSRPLMKRDYALKIRQIEAATNKAIKEGRPVDLEQVARQVAAIRDEALKK